jgi:hypothetical protein
MVGPALDTRIWRERLGIVRAMQRDAMLGLMQTPLNYFFNERTDPRTLGTLTRGLLAARLKAYALQAARPRVRCPDKPVATANV